MVAADFCNIVFSDSDNGIEYLELKIDDSPDENISIYFDKVFAFFTKNSETNVLIHCVSGISRSATFVIAYLMKM